MSTKDPNHEIAEIFYRLNTGELVAEEMLANAFGLVLTNPNVKARDTQLGALLTGLMVKGPTSREIVTLIRTALNIDGLVRYRPTLPSGVKLVGVAGSGKKGNKTFNISTPACLVAAAAGCYVAKPGSAATSSISGSKDFIIAVGARILSPSEMIEVLTTTGFGLFSLEELIPKFDQVYGGKTFGPTPLSFALPAVVNPIACDALLYGLSHPNVALSLRVFSELGYPNVMVVSSTNDGIHCLDELSVLPRNSSGQITQGQVGEVIVFSPEDLGIDEASPDALSPGSSLIENAQIAVEILRGRLPGPRANTVALNAAAILVLSGRTVDLEAGYKVASDIITSGTAYDKLREFVTATGGSLGALATITGVTQ